MFTKNAPEYVVAIQLIWLFTHTHHQQDPPKGEQAFRKLHEAFQAAADAVPQHSVVAWAEAFDAHRQHLPWIVIELHSNIVEWARRLVQDQQQADPIFVAADWPIDDSQQHSDPLPAMADQPGYLLQQPAGVLPAGTDQPPIPTDADIHAAVDNDCGLSPLSPDAQHQASQAEHHSQVHSLCQRTADHSIRDVDREVAGLSIEGFRDEGHSSQAPHFAAAVPLGAPAALAQAGQSPVTAPAVAPADAFALQANATMPPMFVPTYQSPSHQPEGTSLHSPTGPSSASQPNDGVQGTLGYVHLLQESEGAGQHSLIASQPNDSLQGMSVHLLQGVDAAGQHSLTAPQPSGSLHGRPSLLELQQGTQAAEQNMVGVVQPGGSLQGRRTSLEELQARTASEQDLDRALHPERTLLSSAGQPPRQSQPSSHALSQGRFQPHSQSETQSPSQSQSHSPSQSQSWAQLQSQSQSPSMSDEEEVVEDPADDGILPSLSSLLDMSDSDNWAGPASVYLYDTLTLDLDDEPQSVVGRHGRWPAAARSREAHYAQSLCIQAALWKRARSGHARGRRPVIARQRRVLPRLPAAEVCSLVLSTMLGNAMPLLQLLKNLPHPKPLLMRC